MNPEDKLAKIFTDAHDEGLLALNDAVKLHEQVLALQIDMMLDLAAAQHEIKILQEQRDATRLYLGVALAPQEDKDGNDSPEARLRMEVKRILDTIGPDRKIQCIKEMRHSDIANDAWEALGNNQYDPTRRGLGLKEAKDIIDIATSQGHLYLGPGKRSVPL